MIQTVIFWDFLYPFLIEKLIIGGDWWELQKEPWIWHWTHEEVSTLVVWVV